MIAAPHCFHHADRMAVARCLECRRSYCRECVTEHSGRMICAACLRKAVSVQRERRNWRRALVLPAMGVAALGASWLLFYTTGWWLENITAPAPRVDQKVELHICCGPDWQSAWSLILMSSGAITNCAQDAVLPHRAGDTR